MFVIIYKYNQMSYSQENLKNIVESFYLLSAHVW